MIHKKQSTVREAVARTQARRRPTKLLFLGKTPHAQAEYRRIDEHVLQALRDGCKTRMDIQDRASRWLRWRTWQARRQAIMRALHRLEAHGLIRRTTRPGQRPVRYSVV